MMVLQFLLILLPAGVSAAACCYGDRSCGPLTTCNAVGSWCSQSVENCAGCAGFLCGSASLAPTSAPAPSKLDRVSFYGRWYRRGTDMVHSWGPGTVTVRFRHSSSVGIVLDSPSKLYFTCVVDGGRPFVLAHATGTLLVASGLVASETQTHTIQCGRNDEASYGLTVVTDVVLDLGGELLEPEEPIVSALKYEAIGDSITAGFKVNLPPGSLEEPSPANEDVWKTYERHLADAWLAADWRVTARSGISVTPYSAEKVMQDQWPCRDFSWGACPAPWNFTAWQADIVTINLGTNDFTFGNPTQQAFKDAYQAMISLVRAKYREALIFCIIPLIRSCGGGATKWQEMYNGIVDAAADLSDDKVKVVHTGTVAEPWLNCRDDYSDYTHPTVEGNKEFALRLLDTLTDEVRHYFPDKCGGQGPSCNPVPTPPPSQIPSSVPTADVPTVAPTVSTTMQPTVAPTFAPVPSAAPSQEMCAVLYGMCGGQGWSGPDCCVDGLTCVFVNQWYSQCTAGANLRGTSAAQLPQR